MGLLVSSHFTSHHLGICLENRGVTSNSAPTLKLKRGSHLAGLFLWSVSSLDCQYWKPKAPFGHWSSFSPPPDHWDNVSGHHLNPCKKSYRPGFLAKRHAGLVKAKLKNVFQHHLRLKFQEKLWPQWPKTRQRASLSMEPECKCASTC